MELKCLWWFLLLTFHCELSSGGVISIVGPRTVQHGSRYTVFVKALDYDSGKVTISLKGNALGEEIGSEDFDLDNVDENSVTFDLTESPTIQNYTLTAAIPEEKFLQSVEIFTIPKRYSVFIQTDKPIYKPGDIIKFRVLIIDSQMKPYQVAKLRVELFDPLGNVVRVIEEEEEARLEKGIFVIGEDEEDKQFEIATEPIMGIWGIRVISSINEDDESKREEVKTEKKFEVKEYVLPRFEVLVDTNHDVTQNEGVVRLTVYANYTFGEFVKGKAIITARVYDSNFPNIVQQTTSKTVDIEFKRTVEFNIRNELKIVNAIRPYDVKFVTEFEESLTGQKMTKEVPVRVHKTGEYSIEVVSNMKQFKPGFPFKVKAIVRKFDGSLATDKFTPVKLRADYFYKALLCTPVAETKNLDKRYEANREATLKNGIAEFTLNVSDNTTAISITAQFQDVKASLNVSRHDSRSREYLVIKSLTSSPKVNKKVAIEVEGNADWTELYSVVIGRTGILNNKVHELTQKQIDAKKLKFEFLVTPWMAPSVDVIVYYIETKGEIVYDRMKLEFEASLPNNMDIKLSTEKARPGQSCTIKVKTTKNSFVSLLGVDQSVTLLGTGNDIDKSRVAADLNAYNAHKSHPELVIKGNKDRYLDFGESNAFILTNALDGEKKCSLSERIEGLDYSEGQNTDDEDESGLDCEEPEAIDPENPPIRKHFPETWIFKDEEADDDGKLTVDAFAPDTITSFIVTGFAVHPEKGLAIAAQKKLTVFQEFFIKLYLPYSVRFGEILKVDVTVFNYIARPKQAVNAVVKMINDGEFEFVDTAVVAGACKTTGSTDEQRSKTISVPSGNGASTFFLIRALVTGQIKLKVKASARSHGDEVERMMLVEHEGMTKMDNKAVLIDLRNKEFDAFAFELPFAVEKVVWNSIVIEASAIGDLLGPAMANIHNLIRMPTGCSEQQFKSWIPNIAAMKYLKAVGKLTPDFQASGERYLATGYQQLLARRKPDGSYSLWGETGDASIWLSAYVAKLLGHVKDHVSINAKYIVEALDYISNRQKSDGNFPEQVHGYYYMKTKTQQGIPLTAFCTIAYLENVDYRAKYKTQIDKALKYINSKTAQISDNFALAIAAYALALNNDPTALTFLDELKTNAISNDGKMYWNREAKSFNNVESPSVNVEIAAYAIMAFVTANRATEALPVMNWLMTQRSAAGGFYSTTDTVVGLQALAMIATVFYTPNVNMEIKLSYNDKQTIFNINPANAIELQVKDLPKDTRNIRLNPKGKGFAFVQIAYRYNTILEDPVRRFELTATPASTGNPALLNLRICTSFIPDGDIRQSQMTLIEVFLPSGYVYDPTTADLVKSVGVRRVETQNRKTIVVLYFDTINTSEICLNVKAIRKNTIVDLKASVVKIYDYNNFNYRASAFYKPSGEKPCGF